MKSGYKPFLLLIFMTIGCSDKDKLFSVSTESELLRAVQSVNGMLLESDSLPLYLTPHELRVLDSTTTFRNVGKIHRGTKFNVVLLLQTIDDGRGYEFLIRTYAKDGTFIDTYELGIWDAKEKYFCYGSVAKDLTIEKKCDDDALMDQMKISEDGRIVRRTVSKQ
jgi:hypothetical protein